ncbi:MAG TPA: fumarylacetoacetate hydrolase family protein [Acidimicrobiales bacterium]|nr:fumarylacetoacetate hydrolase family protein [Acidimicrobiales bacterium]
MKLFSAQLDGRETLCVERDGGIIPLTTLSPDLPATMEAAVIRGDGWVGEAGRLLAAVPVPAPIPLTTVKVLPAVPRPGNIIAIGRNYREHASEEGVAPPAEPPIFMKVTSSVIAHGDAITWDPTLTNAVDYEAELGVVIGREARNVALDDALGHVFGYTCINDVSARDLQFADVQWIRGKSLETFCPIGPAVVTADEVPDPQGLGIRCYVNGEIRQDSNTKEMFHSVAAIIAHCSRAFRLRSGDVIATGTPGGVGYFSDPQRMLNDGDEVVVEIDGVGRLVNPCRTAPVHG